MSRESSPVNKKQKSSESDAIIKEAINKADYLRYLEELAKLDKMAPDAARRERPMYSKEIVAMVRARSSTLDRFGKDKKPEEIDKLKKFFDELETGQTMKNFRETE